MSQFGREPQIHNSRELHREMKALRAVIFVGAEAPIP